ncbi:RHS repeat domain-containing protein [Tenacibaculum sp. TC6]|uniref:RHS repeat domain-containing protein n=1 Tax=Tenacibaculum sp. TC6 TaxID=3423223 RepID=UPI003D364EA6
MTYDTNGNIKSLKRNKNTENGSNAMDDLSYIYKTDKPNQLLRVHDAVTIDTQANDIKDQTTAANYQYNSIGQLTTNTDEKVNYEYNASGLVTKVLYNNKLRVQFYYNDKGYRTKKVSYKNDGSTVEKTTDYVLDVSGTAMAIYENQQLKELPIYGASRLGMYNKVTGTSVYQLTDHLGNVRSVIAKNGNNAVAATSTTDYYPFGMPMPNRQIVNGEPYRYAYQGQEKDPETGKEAFQLRLWDARIGRWLTTDPYGQFNSPYLGMGNDPINGIDPDGGWKTRFGAWWFRFWNGTGGEIYENEHGDFGLDFGSNEANYNSDGGIDFGEVSLVFSPTGYYDLVGDYKNGWSFDSFGNGQFHGVIIPTPERKNLIARTKRWSEDIDSNTSYGMQGVKNGVQKGYSVVDKVYVFGSGWALFNPSGNISHLDGTPIDRGSLEHINMGVDGLYTIMPLPVRTNATMNMGQFNKAFKGTWITKTSMTVRGKILKIHNILHRYITPKRFVNQVRGKVVNSEN